ncbi:MAG: putative glycosyltransferase EpsH [Pelotomaculum sp. PtaB.Bin104]|nr:MAG: putative glycosyltransferase EpsH [Pelotomaculum sp. PtaB.Bin104]
MLEPDGPVKISLIIISKNERQYLRHTVDHLRLPKTIPCEVIVVDDGSQDNSTRFLETGDYKKIRTIRTSGIGPNGARVLGVEASKGEILLFLDAHVIPEKNL